MNETDYFFLEFIDSDHGKFYNYNIGYFDTETYTLYFSHNNS
ncbi:MAG: hypothetical protein K0S22_334 [Oscillospiraceae bacterium]|jgi:hypothetical protein|nr:hypothetical protein [Oscillospiraceae bacterium]